jgi:hypothetical protein
MAMAKFTLPYEPQYTAHREAEKQRKEARDRLRRATREKASPSIVPEPVHDDETIKGDEKVK